MLERQPTSIWLCLSARTCTCPVFTQAVVQSGALPRLLEALHKSSKAVGAHAAVTAATSEPATTKPELSPLPLGRDMAGEIVWVRVAFT